MPGHDWNECATALMASYPGRFDAEMVTAYVRELIARNIEPGEALREVRRSESPHPPSAGELMAAVRAERRRLESAARRAERLAELERQTLHVVESGS